MSNPYRHNRGLLVNDEGMAKHSSLDQSNEDSSIDFVNARNAYFTKLRDLYCQNIMFKEMAKGSAITGITGTTAVALLNKYWAPFRQQNWRFKLFLLVSAWPVGLYIWGEAFGLRCARGVFDWRLLSLHERKTGEKPLYHPGRVEDMKEKDEEEW